VSAGDRVEPADDAEVNAVIIPGGLTNRLPSCRSAWNTPWSRAWDRKARTRLSARTRRSIPGCSSAAGSDNATPSAQAQRQDPPTNAGPDHRRGAHIGVHRHHLAQLAGARRLQPQVQFQLQRTRDNACQGPRLKPPGQRNRVLDQAGGQLQHLDVARHPPFDAGPQHLDRHRLAVGQGRRMGLGEEAAAIGSPKVTNSASTGWSRSAATTARAMAVGNGASWSSAATSPRRRRGRRCQPGSRAPGRA